MKDLAFYQRVNFTLAQWDEIRTIWYELFDHHKELMQVTFSHVLPEYKDGFFEESQLVDINGEVLTDPDKVYGAEKVDYHTETDISVYIQINEFKPYRSAPFRLYRHITPSYEGDKEPEFRVYKVRGQFYAIVALALLKAIACRWPGSIEMMDEEDELELDTHVLSYINKFAKQFEVQGA